MRVIVLINAINSTYIIITIALNITTYLQKLIVGKFILATPIPKDMNCYPKTK